MKPSSYAADKKGKSGIKRIVNAFGYSKDGIAAAYRYESAFRQVLWLNLILIVLTFILNFDSATKNAADYCVVCFADYRIVQHRR